MRYSCRFCDFVIEGQTQITSQIVEHDRTHTENNIENFKFNEADGKKPKCHACGCEEDHEV